MTTSLYDLLGVAPASTSEELRRAYLVRARQLHPDTGGDPEAMTELNEAWAVLSDPVRRRVYDLGLGEAIAGVDREPAAGEWAPYDADPRDLLDDRPYGRPASLRLLPFVPPGLFVGAIATGCVALVLDEPGMLNLAGGLFFISCVAVAAVALWTIRASVRR